MCVCRPLNQSAFCASVICKWIYVRHIERIMRTCMAFFRRILSAPENTYVQVFEEREGAEGLSRFNATRKVDKEVVQQNVDVSLKMYANLFTFRRQLKVKVEREVNVKSYLLSG